MKNLGFKVKIIILTGAIVISTAVLLSVEFISSLRESFQIEFKSKGIAILESLTSSVQDTLLSRDASTIQGFIDQYREIEGVAFVFVVDENNEVLAHTFVPNIPRKYENLEALVEDRVEIQTRLTNLQGKRILEIEGPILAGLLGRAFVGMDLDIIEDKFVNPLIQRTIFFTVILALLSVGGGVFLLGRVFRPIEQLTRVAKAISSEKKFNQKIEETTDDEIGELTKAFNIMISELKSHTENLEDLVEKRTKKLQESEAHIHAVMESAVNGIIAIDGEGIINQFNRSAEKIFGYRKEEIIGKNVRLLMPESFRSAHDHSLETYKRKGKGEVVGNLVRVEGLRKDGNVFPMEFGLGPIEAAVDHEFVGIIIDITKRKEMEAQLEEAYNTIKKQKERMEKELNVGREIQKSMLPLNFPAFAKYDEFSVFANLIAAREVSGDFYDFFFIDDDFFCVCIGDVSGKGVGAALFMAVAKTLLKSRAADDHSPASILTHLNNELSRDNDACMFVTLFVCLINIKTGDLVFTTAGHNPTYLKRESGEVERLDTVHGPVVGAAEGITYKEERKTLSKGDVLFLYTDGVTEAMDLSNKMYSDDRLEKMITTQKYESVENMIHSIIDSVNEFVGEAEQSDDITALAFEFNGPPQNVNVEKLEIVVKNHLSDMDNINEHFKVFAEQAGISEIIIKKFYVVFDEILSNIISYAYKDENEHDIKIKMGISGNRLTVNILDDGIPFNPLGIDKPDMELSLEDREVGGLGIHIVRNLMDGVFYHRGIDKNVLTLIKYLDADDKVPR
ncbi:MAG: PAS domain S-box protein [Bacteroidetes bacterium]|nr:MAG: PAS domain S-box protein [Bacteroidota bacterium]